MPTRVCPNCFKPTRKEVCPECGIMTVRDKTQSGFFKTLFRRIGFSKPHEGRDLVGRTVVGRYRVTELVGRGGMGEVYRATQLSTLQEVALKVIKAELASDPDSIRRFFREARSAGSINHPNVVRVFDFGQLEDYRLFLAMEFLDGQSLADILRAQRKKGGFRGLDYPTILDVGTQVASALSAAHSKGVIHRDLKPANIIILHEGNLVKVVDFGISKMVGAEASSITRTDLFVGTPAYASPEQAMGGREIDGRSDLYSLGVVLYEMACGHTPFAGIESPVAQLAARVHQDAPPLCGEVPEGRVPIKFCEVVDRLLKRRCEDRYQSAAEVVQELAALALEAGLKARTPARGFLPALLTPPGLARPRTPPPPPIPENLEPTLPVRGPHSEVASREHATKRSLPIWILLIALGVGAAIGGGVYVLVQRAAPDGIKVQSVDLGAPTPAAVSKDAPPAQIENKEPVPVSPKPRECRLTINSHPAGATIFAGDEPLQSKTPTTLTFPCDQAPDSIRLVLKGYKPETFLLKDLGFPEVQAAAVAPELKRAQAPTRKAGGCKSDADCPRGKYCSKGQCKDLL